MNCSLDPGKVAEFSKAFSATGRIWEARDGLCIDYPALDKKPFDAIMFFTKYAHERPFTNPRHPIAHRISILKAIGVSDAKDPSANDKFAAKYCEPGFAEKVWDEFALLMKIADKHKETRKTIEKYTQGPVQTILEKLKEAEQPSIVALLTSKPLEEAYRFLKKIDGISHKIAALFLRDVSCSFGGWDKPERRHFYCLQPVDRWVRVVAERCWENIAGIKDVEKVAKAIVECCRVQGIDPIDFNKGAWFLGANFQKLCGFFRIDTTMRLPDLNTRAIEKFDLAELERAIETLGRAKSPERIYPL